MKVLYYDCFCGISGDMNLGALLDLGVDEAYLRGELSKLNLDAEYELQVKKDNKKGISGTRVDVVLKNAAHIHNDQHHHHEIPMDMGTDDRYTHQHDHGHDQHHHHHEIPMDMETDNRHTQQHDHEHEQHHHHHGIPMDMGTDNRHTHQHDHEHEQHHQHHHHEVPTDMELDNGYHVHRNLKDIENIIMNSSLSDRVKKLSLTIFMKVAEAEAKVHGKPLYEVHFHEVGAIDSIVDIVGAAVCLDYLNVDKIMASSVQVGGGFVKCAHGIIPIPAPATVEILRNIPIKSGIVQFETTTPTGAAILAANVGTFTDNMDLSVEKIGYGIGHRELEIPNVLRIYLGHEDIIDKKEENYILETNIDDMNPELYGYIEEKLFAQGALDVFKTSIFMKKGRVATKLSVLVNEKQEENVLDIIFRETTSIGVRKYKVEKIMMSRDFVKISTQYGTVTVKNAYYQGEKVKYKPEYEDCKRIASEKNIPIARVYQEVYKMIEVDAYDK